jgi:hydroxyethylthiazole kinase
MEKINIINTLNQIKLQTPLVHNITNYVVMNNTANALLAIGASPVMAHAKEEIEDIINISSSAVINIGTLSENWVESMHLAAKTCKTISKPFVLDPVGAGASQYRTRTCNEIIQKGIPSIIRGNASEIMVLANCDIQTKGVDSTINSKSAIEAGISLSKKLNNTVIISGETDFIITGNNITEIHNGSTLMTLVTGMGCTATAITGACLAVEKDHHLAGVTAMAIMGIAGEITSEQVKTPGSFQPKLIDSLYLLSEKDIRTKLRVKSYEY